MIENFTLETPRLFIRTLQPNDLSIIEEFERKNRVHFSPWQTPFSVVQAFPHWLKEIHDGSAMRFLAVDKTSPSALLGLCNFTQIFRGGFQACYLGYRIDQDYEGQGLMFEALKACIQTLFYEKNLHRIMANYMPHNTRSAKLLDRLGFEKEGYAKSYLFINQRWEDHVLTSLTNPHYKAALTS